MSTIAAPPAPNAATGPHRGTPSIQVRDLVKTYGQVHAVNGISFDVYPGEVFGFLGHNGAGKTTTIRMLTGRTHPTGGTGTIGGFDISRQRDRIKPLINLVFEDANLYERFTGLQNLEIFADLYGVPRSRAAELLRTVRLEDAARRKVKTYSSGMKQRLLIARSLINEPKVLFLDEPTRGLDPTSARELRDLIRGLRESGTTVFLTTHYMEEADELCDRVAFLSAGNIVALDTPRQLKLQHGQRTVAVSLRDGSEHVVGLDDADGAARVEGWMRDGQVVTLHSQEGTLEDVFIALAGRAL
ncbi:MAG TPA: ABC transporter ATP-binding protein [Thermomicrobiales bacterium]|jgi:ABC-2 type transport system ATP-binding protein|nr:ABC transporter ATP-binding protein [Thermomicrobiales bacterium]